MIEALATDPIVQLTLQGAASILFLAAAAHKLRAPLEFRAALAGYRILPERVLGAAAVALGAGELAVAIAVLFPATSAAACATGAGLLLLYAAGMAWNLHRGRASIDCGCGGPGGRRPLHPALVLRNAWLAGGLLLAALPARPRSVTALEVVDGVLAIAAIGLLYAAADVALANAARLQPAGEAAWNTD